MMLVLLFSFVGFAVGYVWEYFCSRIIKKDSLILFGWRLHHSLYGLLLLASGSLTQNIILIGLGIGVLIQHTITDGFRFISKE